MIIENWQIINYCWWMRIKFDKNCCWTEDWNTCLRKMYYAFVNDDDLCDEVATLKVEIEFLEAKLKDSMLESRKEAKAKKMYKFLLMIIWLKLLFLVLGYSNDELKIEFLALP